MSLLLGFFSWCLAEMLRSVLKIWFYCYLCNFVFFQSSNKENIVDTNLEKTDPTPNIHDLFRQFNKRFFWDRLNMVEVTWSTSRMTSCAGVCTFRPRTRHCQIRLSAPLMSLRSRKDLVETLLVCLGFTWFPMNFPGFSAWNDSRVSVYDE